LTGADNNTVSAEVQDSQQSESHDDCAGRKNDWDSETNDSHPVNDNRSDRHSIQRRTTWPCTSENAFGQQSAPSASAFEMRVLSSCHKDGPVSQQQKYSARPENQSVRPAPSITSCLLLTALHVQSQIHIWEHLKTCDQPPALGATTPPRTPNQSTRGILTTDKLVAKNCMCELFLFSNFAWGLWAFCVG